MAADDFFKRWAKPKTPLPEVQAEAPGPGISAPSEARAAGAAPVNALPTLEDVAKLSRDSDFSPFMAKGVDQTVLRSAMRKLFSDPHFNLMDGLDTYIGDYNKFEPIPPEMLALLNHAKDLLNPLAQLEKLEADQPGSEVSGAVQGSAEPLLPPLPWTGEGWGEGARSSEAASDDPDIPLDKSSVMPCRVPSPPRRAPPTPLPLAGEGSNDVAAPRRAARRTDSA